MARIQKAFENKFRAILGCTRPRRFDKAMEWFRARAEKLAREQRLPSPQAYAQVYEQVRQRLEPWRRVHRAGLRSAAAPVLEGPDPPRFVCDAGLGGLARWLRAAGYETLWSRVIADEELLRQAQRRSAILLTTDSMLMERRILREGIVRSLWVSPAMKTGEQLAVVLRELGLHLRPPRCMACGGILAPGDKEALRDRIPPKTYRWLDQYFVCQSCGKLLWHGTHWIKIQAQLQQE